MPAQLQLQIPCCRESFMPGWGGGGNLCASACMSDSWGRSSGKELAGVSGLTAIEKDSAALADGNVEWTAIGCN